MSNTPHSVLLGFDIGLKRTGVASGHTLTKAANPAGQLIVKNGRFDWPQVDKLIKHWEPTEIIIGDPKTNDPALKNETLTSSSANTEISQQGLSLDKKVELRDQVAACLILESYFNSL